MPHHGGRHASPKEAAQQFAQVVAIDFAIGDTRWLGGRTRRLVSAAGRNQTLSLSAEIRMPWADVRAEVATWPVVSSRN